MSEILLTPLNDLQNLAQALTLSLSSTQARPIAPPPVEAFLAVDANLADAVQLSRIHQVKQRKIERLKNEVLEMEGRWREIVESLEKGKFDLEEIVEEGEQRIKAIEEAKAGKSIPVHCRRYDIPGVWFELSISFVQVQSHTPSSWHTRKAYLHSPPRRQTCQK